jgi:hypothetical protein
MKVWEDRRADRNRAGERADRCRAQAVNSTITGVVRDTSGAVLPGVYG